MLALSWERGCVQGGPWQGKAVNRIGECVLVLLYADPGLSQLFYNVEENLNGILSPFSGFHILMHNLLSTSTTYWNLKFLSVGTSCGFEMSFIHVIMLFLVTFVQSFLLYTKPILALNWTIAIKAFLEWITWLCCSSSKCLSRFSLVLCSVVYQFLILGQADSLFWFHIYCYFDHFLDYNGIVLC